MSEEKQGRPKGSKGRKTLLQDELATLEAQLKDALLDASMLQRQSRRRDASYISEMKMSMQRVAAIERQIERKMNAGTQPLRDENPKLKAENAALKLEVATLKQRPAEPVVAPAPWEIALKKGTEKGTDYSSDAAMAKFRPEGEETTLERIRRQRGNASPVAAPQENPVVAKMLEASKTLLGKRVTGEPMDTTPTNSSKGDSFPQELSNRNRILLTPPRLDVVPGPSTDSLARPRPVITPAESEQKAIAMMGSQFTSGEALDEKVRRIQAESRRDAPKSQISEIQASLDHADDVERCLADGKALLAKLKAEQATSDIT